MKTAEQIAEEYAADLFNPLSRDRYLTDKETDIIRRQIAAALKEYGAEVRNEALDEACTAVYGQCDNDNVAQRTVDAIRKMKV